MASIQGIFQNLPEFEFGEYILRKLKVKDSKEIRELCSDRETMELLRAPTTKTIEDARNFIDMMNVYYTLRYRADWGIYDKSNNMCIGLFSIHNISFTDNRIDIGFMIGKKYRRQGIMNTIVNGMIQKLFDIYNIHMIIIITSIRNHGCIEFCKNLKVSQEVSIRDYFYNRISKRYENVKIMFIINENNQKMY